MPDGLIEDGFVSLDGPVIREVGPMSRLDASPSQTLDVMGRNVIPGLIDLHIHGIGGFDAMEGGAAGMAAGTIVTTGTITIAGITIVIWATTIGMAIAITGTERHHAPWTAGGDAGRLCRPQSFGNSRPISR